METILALVAVLALSMIVHVIGLVSYVRLANRQIVAMSEIGQTITHATAAIRSGFKGLRRKISHSDELTATKRQEILQLILDSERRCMDQIRDLEHTIQLQGIKTGTAGTSVNIHGGASGINNIGQNEIQGNQR